MINEIDDKSIPYKVSLREILLLVTLRRAEYASYTIDYQAGKPVRIVGNISQLLDNNAVMRELNMSDDQAIKTVLRQHKITIKPINHGQ